LLGRDSDVSLHTCSHPEFDAWRWNHYWVELDSVVEFKRQVYREALIELSHLLGEEVILGNDAAYRNHGKQSLAYSGKSTKTSK